MNTLMDARKITYQKPVRLKTSKTMNFNLKSSVLVTMAVTVLLTGSTNTASAEGSNNLRGQRVLIGDRNIPAAVMTCPHFNPGSNTACSFPAGNMMVGACCYSSSSKNKDEPTNTDAQWCSCNHKESPGKFACQPYSYPEGDCPKDIPTNPPVSTSASTPVTRRTTVSWCPYQPKTNDVCTLPTGMSSGSCTWSKTAPHSPTTKGTTTTNVCSCKASKFTCVQTITRN